MEKKFKYIDIFYLKYWNLKVNYHINFVGRIENEKK
tara:strand:- start:349 stop:456 length:108 start_codon:yes stop_codon:yes gene_type:complete